ncbi:MAG: GNAT family N-acetyltransferase [Rickettsiales bacterium]|nr:GNAT family N-acetyltransferase [Rickettsiales bacterium]
MRALGKEAYAEFFAHYRSSASFSPIIGAVLEGTQKGLVFALDEHAHDAAFVVHHFGFAHYIEVSKTLSFSATLCAALIDSYMPSDIGKVVRCYAIPDEWLQPFAACEHIAVSERIRFEFIGQSAGNVAARPVQPADMPRLALLGLELGSRFWPSEEAFLQQAKAQVVEEKGELVSLCYAAAVSGGKAEIDIVTHPNHRGKGYAAQAAQAFIAQCVQSGLEPSWDCYSNNKASIAVAKRLGFKESLHYPYATIRLQAG